MTQLSELDQGGGSKGMEHVRKKHNPQQRNAPPGTAKSVMSGPELRPGPNFTELLSTKICLAQNFFLDENRITTQISISYILHVTGIQLLFAYPENHRLTSNFKASLKMLLAGVL